MFLRGCLVLACALSAVTAQPLEESVFKQLTAAELREIELRQNPSLLDFAARTGESVFIEISAPSQGAIVQDGVNVLMDCFPWLSNFPGGTIRWYRYRYEDLDHTILGMRTLQRKADLQPPSLRRIAGEFDRYYNITRVRIQEGAENPHRGVYECEVCVARDTPFEVCHSANVTLATAGRPPFVNCTTGRDPDSEDNGNVIYRIGATICIRVDPVDHTRNDPIQIELRCPIPDEDRENNIPPRIPRPDLTWTHVDREGNMASFTPATFGTDDDEFVDTFPLLDPLASMGIFFLNTNPDPIEAQDSLIFNTFNVTKNTSDPRYEILMQAFGTWTCRVNNSLGDEMKTTTFSDMCEMEGIPSILRQSCDLAGELIEFDLARVQRGQVSAIPIGCDVCVRQTAEVWLRIDCPTNVPPISITWQDEDGNELQGEGNTLLVQTPGTYTCIADFGVDGMDTESTTVGFIPDVPLTFLREGTMDTGCSRLRTNETFPDSDVCAFEDESLRLECESRLENVTGLVTPPGTMSVETFDSIQLVNEDVYFCTLSQNNEDVGRCIAVTGGALNVTVYRPATILDVPDDTCIARADTSYLPVMLSSPPPPVVILCCEADGEPTPTTTWRRIVTDPVTGIAREEILSDGDPDISIDFNNRLTIANYTSARDGTYVCRTENIAGVDAGTASITSQPDGAQWVMSNWSKCDPDCVNGTRTRSVVCRSTLDNRVRLDSDCDCPKPAQSESCENVPGLDFCYFTPIWRTGEYGPCSKGCAGGFRTRKVECAIPFDGTVVPKTRCRELYEYMPVAYDICFNKCCHTDVYPTYCRYTGTQFCDQPVYQQNCCWTCGLTVVP